MIQNHSSSQTNCAIAATPDLFLEIVGNQTLKPINLKSSSYGSKAKGTTKGKAIELHLNISDDLWSPTSLRPKETRTQMDGSRGPVIPPGPTSKGDNLNKTTNPENLVYFNTLGFSTNLTANFLKYDPHAKRDPKVKVIFF